MWYVPRLNACIAASEPPEPADEILQLVFFELNDPTALTIAAKRFHNFSQDPYIRAQYFLTRYGNIQAMFWALGRGKVMNERVFDVCNAFAAKEFKS